MTFEFSKDLTCIAAYTEGLQWYRARVHDKNQLRLSDLDEVRNIVNMDHGEKVYAIKNSSNFDLQEEMWCPNDFLESLKCIQLQNMFNMCSIDINNVTKVHYSVFIGSTKQLTKDFSHMAHNASSAFKSGKVLVPPLQTRSSRNPKNQKSQGIKTGERVGHASVIHVNNHDCHQSWH
ncbi:hypothetical protein TNCV_5097141 [Trichonephila clavipes]|nr:hypothetical protein TNCV_5097141 [Trichonephila clavipes]